MSREIVNTTVENDDTSTPANYYVDNKKLYAAMREYIYKVRDAEAAGVQTPRVSEYIGSCILLIAEKLSLNRNFILYPFRDEMIADGIDNCLYYINNFNPDKYNNPFAYFTQISYYAFIRRIQREKKQLYIKHKAYQNASVNGMISDYQEGDSDQMPGMTSTESDYMDNLVIDFEKKIKEKKESKKKKNLETKTKED